MELNLSDEAKSFLDNYEELLKENSLSKSKADFIFNAINKFTTDGADVSGVTATAGDVDEGKIFVDSTGTEVEGTSTYKADYIALSDNIDDLNEDLEEVIEDEAPDGFLEEDIYFKE